MSRHLIVIVIIVGLFSAGSNFLFFTPMQSSNLEGEIGAGGHYGLLGTSDDKGITLDIHILGHPLSLYLLTQANYYIWEDGGNLNYNEVLFPIGNGTYIMKPNSSDLWVYTLHNWSNESVIFWGKLTVGVDRGLLDIAIPVVGFVGISVIAVLIVYKLLTRLGNG